MLIALYGLLRYMYELLRPSNFNLLNFHNFWSGCDPCLSFFYSLGLYYTIDKTFFLRMQTTDGCLYSKGKEKSLFLRTVLDESKLKAKCSLGCEINCVLRKKYRPVLTEKAAFSQFWTGISARKSKCSKLIVKVGKIERMT